MLGNDRSLKDLSFGTNIDHLAPHHGPAQAKKHDFFSNFWSSFRADGRILKIFSPIDRGPQNEELVPLWSIWAAVRPKALQKTKKVGKTHKNFSKFSNFFRFFEIARASHGAKPPKWHQFFALRSSIDG